MAKTKITPGKLETLTRIELSEAALLVKLTKKILNDVEKQLEQMHFWCVSKVVLDWLNGHPSRKKRSQRSRMKMMCHTTAHRLHDTQTLRFFPLYATLQPRSLFLELWFLYCARVKRAGCRRGDEVHKTTGWSVLCHSANHASCTLPGQSPARTLAYYLVATR
ncbi:hypothetical protein TKK_0016110 [Trichogramma kaykai]